MRRVSPAPLPVPVERLVGIGLVRPLTVRPLSGVCASSLSRPVPPAVSFAERPARAFRTGFLTAFFTVRRAGAAVFFAVFFAALRVGVFAFAVFRPVLRCGFANFLAEFFLADDRTGDPDFRFATVRFRPLLVPVFLAICLSRLQRSRARKAPDNGRPRLTEHP
jgi:hypothetical protein